MSLPKRQLPGQLVVANRRTYGRKYFLRPDEELNSTVGYLYGKAALDNHQTPHVACVMSNHYHDMRTDRMGTRDGFMRQFHSNLARKRNLQLGRRDHFWTGGLPGDMVVLEMDALVEQLLYVVMQPVAAGCVDRVEEWSGFQILPRHWGKKMVFDRPAQCGDTMPEKIEFIPMPPPGFEVYPLEDVIEFFENLIEEEEERYRRLRDSNGVSVLGTVACERLNPFHCPKTQAPMRTLNPRFACKDKSRAAVAIKYQKAFEARHRSCRGSCEGDGAHVIFPCGTVQMSKLAKYPVEPLRPHDPHLISRVWTRKLTGSWLAFETSKAA